MLESELPENATVNEELQNQINVWSQLHDFEKIYQSAPVGLCVLDRELRFLHLNECFAQINGVPVKEHIGHTVWEIVPDIAEQAEQTMKKIMTDGELITLEIEGQTPSQPGIQRCWKETWQPIKNRTDEILGVSVVAIEITEQKRALEENKKLNEKIEFDKNYLEKILDTIPTAIELIEAEGGKISYINKHAIMLNGFDYVGNEVKDRISEVLRPDGAPCQKDDLPFFDTLNGEYAFNKEMIIKNYSGQLIPITVSSAPIFDCSTPICFYPLQRKNSKLYFHA